MKGHTKLGSPANSPSLFFSPVLTMATGEIREIRFPQEGYVIHTWGKQTISFSLDFPRIHLNFPETRPWCNQRNQFWHEC